MFVLTFRIDLSKVFRKYINILYLYILILYIYIYICIREIEIIIINIYRRNDIKIIYYFYNIDYFEILNVLKNVLRKNK